MQYNDFFPTFFVFALFIDFSILIFNSKVLRLRGGTSPRDGYLEVQGEHPGWGVVCDSKNGWSLREAHVVCRQLGYTRYIPNFN